MEKTSKPNTKKRYAKPAMIIERFAANVYCAGCDSSSAASAGIGELYKVAVENINRAPNGQTMQGNIYYETNRIPGPQVSGDNPDQRANAGVADVSYRAVDGYVYFDKAGTEGYVINGSDPDTNQWWHVYIFNPLTYENGKWIMYDSYTFAAAETSLAVASKS